MKSIFKKIYENMPDEMRHRFARKLVKPPTEIPLDFCFKIAKTESELEAAFAILHDAYVEQGYMKPSASGIRVTKYHALPTTTTLIAKYKEQVVGTISILRDAGLGLPLDSAFNLQILKNKFGQIAEVSSLAIKKEFRKEHGYLLWPLLKYFYHYSKHLMRLKAIVVGVHPKWSDFYLGILGFQRIYENTVSHYDFANGNPVVGFFLDLEMAPIEYASMYSQVPDEQNLLRFFTREVSANFDLPEREFYKVSDPVMSPDLLKHFFIDRTEIFSHLTRQEALAIIGAYPQKQYQFVIECIREKSRVQGRKEIRFKVSCRGLYLDDSGNFNILEVVNVSQEGLEVIGEIPKTAKAIKVQMAEKKVIDLETEVLWQQGKSSGIKILNVHRDWLEFIKYLGQDFKSNVG